MTISEAIQILQANAQLLHFEHPHLRLEEAIVVVIEALSKPTPPSNLDETAEEYAPDFSNDLASKAAVDAVRDAFKAGAEWMAGQSGYEAGYKQAVEDVGRMIDEKLKAAGFVIADGKIVRAETK